MSSLDMSLRPLRTALTDLSLLIWVALSAGLILAAMLVARVSSEGFVVIALALMVMVVVGSLRWPRAMLVIVALGPILDRFLIAPSMPANVEAVGQYAAEALLAVVATVLAIVGLRNGRLLLALRHPTTIGLGLFVILSLVSAAVNRVPPVEMAAGFFYTLDALIVFYLCRVIGFTHRQAIMAIGAVGAAVLLMAIIGIAQALLGPNILGLSAVAGRSGEVDRLGSVVRNPNVLGSLIALNLPLALFGAIRLSRPRLRWAMASAAVLLAMALLLSYSRGSWLGLIVGAGAVMLIFDRKVLLAMIGVGALAFVLVSVMPRDLLVGPNRNGTVAPPPTFNIVGTTTNRVGNVGMGRDLRTLLVLNAIPILRDHPLLGVGPGRYGGAAAEHFSSPIYTKYGTGKLLLRQQTVDNFWLHLMVEAGLLGVLPFLLAIAVLLGQLVSAVRRSIGSRYVMIGGILAGTAAMCIITGSTMGLEANAEAFMFWFLLGVGSLYGSEQLTQPAQAGPVTPGV